MGDFFGVSLIFDIFRGVLSLYRTAFFLFLPDFGYSRELNYIYMDFEFLNLLVRGFRLDRLSTQHASHYFYNR